MSTHTPGTGWNTGATPERAEIIRLRAIVKSYERDPLIAAAPDLLAALQAIVACIPDHGTQDQIDPFKMASIARAAIAKAEGAS